MRVGDCDFSKQYVLVQNFIVKYLACPRSALPALPAIGTFWTPGYGFPPHARLSIFWQRSQRFPKPYTSCLEDRRSEVVYLLLCTLPGVLELKQLPAGLRRSSVVPLSRTTMPTFLTEQRLHREASLSSFGGVATARAANTGEPSPDQEFVLEL